MVYVTTFVLMLCIALPACAWPSDPGSVLAYKRNQELLDLQRQIQPQTPATLTGAKLTPNYLTGFLSLGTGQELLDAQATLLKAWNSSATISKLIADDATQAPVTLPDKFKSGPLNELLGELVVLYYATWQGVEGARREYFKQIQPEQLANVTKYGPWGLTNTPPFGQQFIPEGPHSPGFFVNNFFYPEDPEAGNAVTAYGGTYLDVSKGPLLMNIPQIDDYFLITFYNAYGEVIYTLGTRVGTTKAKTVIIASDSDTNLGNFPASDIVKVPGVDGFVLSRIVGKPRYFNITTVRPKQQQVTRSYWWGVDPAVYYIYNNMDPLYYWKVAGLVLARNPRQGLTAKQQQLLRDLQFTSEGLQVDNLSADQKSALIAAIPIAAQGLAQSFYMIGPKWQGYWYNTIWNSIPGSYYQLDAAFFKGFWIANLVENAAYVLQFVDSEVRPLNGRYNYSMTFTAPPPSKGAFWSMQTMRLDQFAMADGMDFVNTRELNQAGFVYGKALAGLDSPQAGGKGALVKSSDGSFTVALSAKPKPSNFKGNYLRIVDYVPFYIMLRIYNPSSEVVQDKYAPPPVVRQGGVQT